MSSIRISRRVNAPRASVYRALLDPRAVGTWRVPSGMTSHVHAFDAREGGSFRISLTYDAPTGTGKTTPHTDTNHGRFEKLVPNEQLVEVVEFETTDPALRGEMTITTTLVEADGGTYVLAVHDGVPRACRTPRTRPAGGRRSRSSRRSWKPVEAGVTSLECQNSLVLTAVAQAFRPARILGGNVTCKRPADVAASIRHAAICIAIVALTAAFGSSVAGQLASRPVDEWTKVLDAPERVAALRVDEVVSRLGLSSDAVVADLGAGTGPFVVSLAKAVPSGKVYAVEVDADFLPHIQQKARAAGVTNVRTVLGEFTDPKLPASDTDVAFMHDVLHHIDDRAAYLKGLSKYLKPTARIAIVDYHPAQSPHQDQPAMLVSKAQAQALLAEAGFKPVQDIPLFSDKWFVVFSR